MSSILQKFSGTQSEVAALRLISGRWTFWRFDDVMLSLDRPDCELFYLPNPKVPGEWNGVIFLALTDPFAELLYIYVEASQRRQALGRQMFSDALKIVFCERKLADLFLEVRVSNSPAQKLYESFGMRKTEIRRGYYSDGEDALIYHLPNQSI